MLFIDLCKRNFFNCKLVGRQQTLSQLAATLGLGREADMHLARKVVCLKQVVLLQDLQRFQRHFMSRIDDDDIVTAKLFK